MTFVFFKEIKAYDITFVTQSYDLTNCLMFKLLDITRNAQPSKKDKISEASLKSKLMGALFRCDGVNVVSGELTGAKRRYYYW